MMALVLMLLSGCTATSANSEPTLVTPQPQVESVVATTSGTENGYYATLDIKVKNSGAEGTVLIQASITQNGKTTTNGMPVYLTQGEEQELKLTFPLVWGGGEFTSNVQAIMPTAATITNSNPSSTTETNSSLSSTTNPNNLFTSQTISQGPGLQTLVYTFTPVYTGYVTISGTSSSSTGYILVVNTTSGISTTYTFGNGTTINAPLTSGSSYGIYFGNHDTSGAITAILTGTYSSTLSTPNLNDLFTSQAISQGPGVQTVVYSFTPTNPGYISISGTSSSSTGYISIINTNSGASNTYSFGNGNAINFPLNVGNTYSIYFGNHDTAGTITATLTGTYTISPSTSSQNNLFTSKTLYVNPGMQTIVYTFTPSYTGTLNISGTSTSSTGYILIINNSSGGSNTYAFGMGTTVSVPLNAGVNYGIYFGNHDTSGTVTVTLTGIY